MSVFKTIAALLLGCGVIGFRVHGADYVDLENEIGRLKKELSAVRTDRQRNMDDVIKDKKEFAAYQDRTASRKNSLARETDSLKRQIALFGQKKDSLSAIAAGFDQRKREYGLLQERFRERLVAACTPLVPLSKKSPPAVEKQSTAALSFLMNDCATKSVDNVEAVHRLVQIIRNMEDASCAIQTGQETPNLQQMQRSLLMLRIGSVFEAVVDDDGKNGALWRGNDTTGRPLWQALTDAETRSMVLTAINIRESRALPAFVVLPFVAPPLKETKK